MNPLNTKSDRHILLIDEGNLLVRLYGALLRNRGYHIHEVTNLMMVRQFLALDFNFEILICDVRGVNEYRVRILKDMLPQIQARGTQVILIGPAEHALLHQLPFPVIYSDDKNGYELLVNQILANARHSLAPAFA